MSDTRFITQQKEDKVTLQPDQCEKQFASLIREARPSFKTLSVDANLESSRSHSYLHSYPADIADHSCQGMKIFPMLSDALINEGIRVLYFNNPNREHILALAQTLEANPDLENLTLVNSRNKTTIAEWVCAAPIVRAVKNNNSLTFLSFDFTQDNSMVVSALVDTLKENNKLRILHINTSNGIKAAEAEQIFHSLSVNKSLRKLYLNDIDFTITTFQALKDMLMTNRTLQELSLGSCTYEKLEHLQLLAEGLRGNESLTDIHLFRLLPLDKQKAKALDWYIESEAAAILKTGQSPKLTVHTNRAVLLRRRPSTGLFVTCSDSDEESDKLEVAQAKTIGPST